MNIPAIPTSSVGTLPAVLTRLEAHVTKAQEKPSDRTYLQAIMASTQETVANVVGAVAVAFFALVDEAIHVSCVTAKALPVAFKLTIGKLTGLDKYITSPALTGEDFVGHLSKIWACFTLQVAALSSLVLGADCVLNQARKFGLLSTGQTGPDAPKDLAPAGT